MSQCLFSDDELLSSRLLLFSFLSFSLFTLFISFLRLITSPTIFVDENIIFQSEGLSKTFKKRKSDIGNAGFSSNLLTFGALSERYDRLFAMIVDNEGNVRLSQSFVDGLSGSTVIVKTKEGQDEGNSPEAIENTEQFKKRLLEVMRVLAKRERFGDTENTFRDDFVRAVSFADESENEFKFPFEQNDQSFVPLRFGSVLAELIVVPDDHEQLNAQKKPKKKNRKQVALKEQKKLKKVTEQQNREMFEANSFLSKQKHMKIAPKVFEWKKMVSSSFLHPVSCASVGRFSVGHFPMAPSESAFHFASVAMSITSLPTNLIPLSALLFCPEQSNESLNKVLFPFDFF
jgi:hypothetical protein